MANLAGHFPTEAVALGWQTMVDLQTHVGMRDEVFDAVEVAVGQFGDRIAPLAMLPEEIYRNAITNARVIVTPLVPAQGLVPAVPAVTRPLTPVETGQCGMLWRIASRIFWVRAGNRWDNYLDFDVMVDPAARANAFPPGAHGVGVGVAPPPPPQPAVVPLKYKQSSVTDQGDDSEFLAPTRVEIDTWNQNYFQQEQAVPIEEEEPTEIQTKGYDVRIQSGRTPYVDMGVWGPFGRKLMRALKFRNWIPAGDGSFIQKEMTGPENFLVYTFVWRVFVVAAKMTRSVRGWAMDRYYKNLEKLLTKWPLCWFLIYAADDKMRSEHMERIRRRIAQSIAQGGAPPRDWDPDHP